MLSTSNITLAPNKTPPSNFKELFSIIPRSGLSDIWKSAASSSSDLKSWADHAVANIPSVRDKRIDFLEALALSKIGVGQLSTYALEWSRLVDELSDETNRAFLWEIEKDCDLKAPQFLELVDGIVKACNRPESTIVVENHANLVALARKAFENVKVEIKESVYDFLGMSFQNDEKTQDIVREVNAIKGLFAARKIALYTAIVKKNPSSYPAAYQEIVKVAQNRALIEKAADFRISVPTDEKHPSLEKNDLQLLKLLDPYTKEDMLKKRLSLASIFLSQEIKEGAKTWAPLILKVFTDAMACKTIGVKDLLPFFKALLEKAPEGFKFHDVANRLLTFNHPACTTEAISYLCKEMQYLKTLGKERCTAEWRKRNLFESITKAISLSSFTDLSRLKEYRDHIPEVKTQKGQTSDEKQQPFLHAFLWRAFEVAKNDQEAEEALKLFYQENPAAYETFFEPAFKLIIRLHKEKMLKTDSSSLQPEEKEKLIEKQVEECKKQISGLLNHAERYVINNFSKELAGKLKLPMPMHIVNLLIFEEGVSPDLAKFAIEYLNKSLENKKSYLADHHIQTIISNVVSNIGKFEKSPNLSLLISYLLNYGDNELMKACSTLDPSEREPFYAVVFQELAKRKQADLLFKLLKNHLWQEGEPSVDFIKQTIAFFMDNPTSEWVGTRCEIFNKVKELIGFSKTEKLSLWQGLFDFWHQQFIEKEGFPTFERHQAVLRTIDPLWENLEDERKKRILQQLYSFIPSGGSLQESLAQSRHLMQVFRRARVSFKGDKTSKGLLYHLEEALNNHYRELLKDLESHKAPLNNQEVQQLMLFFRQVMQLDYHERLLDLETRMRLHRIVSKISLDSPATLLDLALLYKKQIENMSQTEKTLVIASRLVPLTMHISNIIRTTELDLIERRGGIRNLVDQFVGMLEKIANCPVTEKDNVYKEQFLTDVLYSLPYDYLTPKILGIKLPDSIRNPFLFYFRTHGSNETSENMKAMLANLMTYRNNETLRLGWSAFKVHLECINEWPVRDRIECLSFFLYNSLIYSLKDLNEKEIRSEMVEQTVAWADQIEEKELEWSALMLCHLADQFLSKPKSDVFDFLMACKLYTKALQHPVLSNDRIEFIWKIIEEYLPNFQTLEMQAVEVLKAVFLLKELAQERLQSKTLDVAKLSGCVSDYVAYLKSALLQGATEAQLKETAALLDLFKETPLPFSHEETYALAGSMNELFTHYHFPKGWQKDRELTPLIKWNESFLNYSTAQGARETVLVCSALKSSLRLAIVPYVVPPITQKRETFTLEGKNLDVLREQILGGLEGLLQKPNVPEDFIETLTVASLFFQGTTQQKERLCTLLSNYYRGSSFVRAMRLLLKGEYETDKVGEILDRIKCWLENYGSQLEPVQIFTQILPLLKLFSQNDQPQLFCQWMKEFLKATKGFAYTAYHPCFSFFKKWLHVAMEDSIKGSKQRDELFVFLFTHLREHLTSFSKGMKEFYSHSKSLAQFMDKEAYNTLLFAEKVIKETVDISPACVTEIRELFKAAQGMVGQVFSTSMLRDSKSIAGMLQIKYDIEKLLASKFWSPQT